VTKLASRFCSDNAPANTYGYGVKAEHFMDVYLSGDHLPPTNMLSNVGFGSIIKHGV
jgi:hypothetical protein